jgi:hypothetical protein
MCFDCTIHINENFLILRQPSPIFSKIHIGLHVMYLLLLSHLNETNFVDGFSRNDSKESFMDIRMVGNNLLPKSNGRTGKCGEFKCCLSQFCE